MDRQCIRIPSELFAPAESSRFEGNIDLSAVETGSDVYTFSKPLAWRVDITNTGGAFLVAGTVEGEARAVCARCLDEFAFPVAGEIEGYYLIGPDSRAPEGMDDDEFDILPDDNAIDLEPLIRAALLLEFPLIPLCDDDCQGLCPACGANLNEGPCCCAAADREADEAPSGASRPHPFAALKDYTFE